MSIVNVNNYEIAKFWNLDNKLVQFFGEFGVDGNSQFNADLTAVGRAYLNGGCTVAGGHLFVEGGDLNVLSGATNLHTSAQDDVAIIDSTGADIMMVADGGDVTFPKGALRGGSGGLSINTSVVGQTATFYEDRSVRFWGTDFNYNTAAVRAKSLVTTAGISAASGTNSLVVNATNTTITGPTVVSGTLNSGALSVTGAASMPGYTWAAGFVSATGTKITSTGQVIWSVSRGGTGAYTISWVTAHPAGGNYIVIVCGQGVMAIVRSAVLPTSTSFQVSLYTNGTSTLSDGVFSFMVLAS